MEKTNEEQRNSGSLEIILKEWASLGKASKNIEEVTLGSVLKDNEKWAYNIRKEFEEDIRDKYGRLGLEAFSSIPVVIGAAISGFGRLVGFPYLGPLYFGINLFLGGIPSFSGKAFIKAAFDQIKFAFGMTLPFTDKIYENAVQNAPEAYEFMRSIIDKF